LTLPSRLVSDRMQARGLKYMFGGKRFSGRAIDKSREETSNVDVWGWRDAARTGSREELGGRFLSFAFAGLGMGYEPKD